MKVTKQSEGGQEVVLSPEELEKINRLSRKELKAEEVYPFSVYLCDNEVDRDGERFPKKTLEELAGLFLGKSGIFDHNWSAQGQAARIYETEVLEEPDVVTESGERYAFLKARAYMVRTEENRGLITEIEAGIKKEVSVGCSVKRSECSICGKEMGVCEHRKGTSYGGELCYADLVEATDAYEFSFVAVPAQPRAGVMKKMKGTEVSLKELVRGNELCQKELTRLEKQAELGRNYIAALRREVVRLGGLVDKGMGIEVLTSITEKLEEEELLQMKATYEARVEERYPLNTQIDYGREDQQARPEDRAFLI